MDDLDLSRTGNIFGSKTDEEDENSLTLTDDSLLHKPTRPTYLNFENIRFTPRVIEFVDAFEGKQLSVVWKIQNVGRNPVVIKIGEPNSFIFQLKYPNPYATFLASGSSIVKTISYTYHSDDLVQRSQIPVQIDGIWFDYPIVVKKAVAEIEVEPQKLHFKVINLGATATSMTLRIHNKGGRRTKFEIDVGKNEMNLVVNPLQGTVKPKQFVDVNVEMMGCTEGEFYQEVWIKTSDAPIRVPVLVEVVRPHLQVVHPKGTENFTLISFRPAYTGTQSANSFIVRNYSTEATLFVILAEINGELQDLNKGRKLTDAYSMFKVTAEEGLLAPFESRIMKVLFCPKGVVKKKGWHHRKNVEKNQTDGQYIVFLRINRVHCIEQKELAKLQMKTIRQKIMEKVDPEKSLQVVKEHSEIRRTFVFETQPEGTFLETIDDFLMDTPETGEEVVRLCLHGQAIEPDFTLQPNSFEYGTLTLGQKENKILKITNNGIIPVKCVFSKMRNVKVTPNSAWLKTDKSEEFLICLTPKFAGVFRTSMKVKIYAKSDDLTKTTKSLVVISERNVVLTYTAQDRVIPHPSDSTNLPASFKALGYPKTANMYKNIKKLPYSVVLGMKYGFKPAWMMKEKDQTTNVDNAIVALPDDRPRSYYSWPKNRICRALFTGLFRYSPPEDLAYTLSAEGRIMKKMREDIWYEFLSKKLNQAEVIRYCLECEESYRSCGYSQYKPVSNDYVPNLEWCKKYMGFKDSYPENSLVPLTPLFLYHIHVEPRLINFSTVAVSVRAQETVTIINTNPFPISIRFVSGKSAVFLLEEGTLTIQPSGTKYIQVYFQTNDLGRYFGFLNYIINGSHEFKITISAFVTPKSLILRDRDLYLEFGKYDMKDPFQVRSVFLPVQNILQAPVTYRWVFSPDSAYFTEIMNGEIPPRSKLLAEIFFNLSPTTSFYSETTFISESGCTKLIKLGHPYKKVAVDFLTNRVDMRDIPLNLPTKVKPIIQNSCYHDVSFEVLTPDPMPGVTVEPRYGVIKSRSFYPLDIVVQLPVIMKFSFEVILLIHFVTRISVKIIGNVVLPVIKLKPTEVNLQKICAQSFDTFTICATNAGNTPAEMEINLKSCPELKTADGQSEWYLLPRKSVKITINFEPLEATRYVFYLPIIINRMLGPPLVQESETEYVSFYVAAFESSYKNFGKVFDSQSNRNRLPCIFLSCHISQKILELSTLSLEFRKRPTDATFQSQTIEISNNYVDEVTFCIRNDDLGEINDSPFSLTPLTSEFVDYRLKSLKVTLRRGERIEFKASFNPKRPGHFKVAIPIFIRGYNSGFVFNYIRMSGHLSPPRIRPMYTEVHFPPLPLGVGCDIILSVIAENYYTNDVIHCIVWNTKTKNYDLSKAQLTTSWLVEPQVNMCGIRQEFKLQINFQSSVPVDLRAYVLLIDSNGGYATIFVTGVADNSTLTTHAFLTTKTFNYKLVREEPVWLKRNEPIHLIPLKKASLKQAEMFEKQERKFQKKERSVDVVASDQKVEYTEKIERKIHRKDHSIDGLASDHKVNANEMDNSLPKLTVDTGPKLILHTRKSIIKPTVLGIPDLTMGFSGTTINTVKVEALHSFSSRTDNSYGSTVVTATQRKRQKSLNEHAYPNFPGEGNPHRNYFQKTLSYVERWIFEVAMRCEQYFSIPDSFQSVRLKRCGYKSFSVRDGSDNPMKKDFLDFLEEIVGKDQTLPARPIHQDGFPVESASALHLFFLEILRYLETRGCLFPHIKPEFLLEYDSYLYYLKGNQNTEIFTWKGSEEGMSSFMKVSKDIQGSQAMRFKTDVDSLLKEGLNISSEEFLNNKKSLLLEEDYQGSSSNLGNMSRMQSSEIRVPHPDFLNNIATGKRFEHRNDVLDRSSFKARATQAWFDIAIQIFRVLVLTKVVQKSTIPQVHVVELNDKISETTDLLSVLNYNKKLKTIPSLINVSIQSTNIYSREEIILLNWLSYHLHVQRTILWKEKEPCVRSLNCFDKDLSDSTALIAVTASHCPYIVREYFEDVFPKPDTLNKLHHNAGKLILAWRALEIGITVETGDIVNPNPVFMVMLVTHLYEILPSLHPHSLICFAAPLNSELMRTIQVKNDSPERLTYRAKFFGEHEGFFRVDINSDIDLGPFKSTNINIIYRARKIKKASATLLLSGCTLSPNFGRPLTFYLEGEPSGLPELDKYSFAAPLYKVICSEIPVKPPYADPAVYEICYTTKQPKYNGETDIGLEVKPWSKIWKRKVSRRLFLNQDEVITQDKKRESVLSITIACLTIKKRSFWLLFRSKVSDFIILIEITPRALEPLTVVQGFYSSTWKPDSICQCQREAKNIKSTAITCPLLTAINIPTRNDALWKALRTMFIKTLNPEEKPFWAQHFETDIGICLILWLLSPEEEEEVIDEFVHVLSTRVSYSLHLESLHHKSLTTLSRIEIMDVRETSEVSLPIHISRFGSKKQIFKLTMTSENGKEVRHLKVYLRRPESTGQFKDYKNKASLFSGAYDEKPES